MTSAPKTYIADDELAALIEDASESGEPVRIVTRKANYRVTVEDVEQVRPDPETVAQSIEGIKAAAGGWRGNVPEDFKDYIAERR